ncbi:involucrin-like [Lates japonicus]
MESVPVRRKSCLLRLRENCPFRKLRRQTYALSATASAPIGSYWNNVGLPTSNRPISTVCSQPLPPLSGVSPSDQSEAATDVHMEEDPPAAGNQNLQNLQNQQNPENRAEDFMELNDNVDPETGERAQG